MLLSHSARFFFLKFLEQGRRKRIRRRQQAVLFTTVETLERRRLLSTLSYEAPFGNGPDDLTLRFNEKPSGKVFVELFDNILQKVVVKRPLPVIDSVEIVGADGEDDTLTIDYFFGGFFDIPEGIFFDGGTGLGTDVINVQADLDFTLTNGNLAIPAGGILVFLEVEEITLTGGTGNNTLDASAYTDGGVTLIGGDGDDILKGRERR